MVALVCNLMHNDADANECQSHTMDVMPKDSAISVRVTTEVKAAAEKAAAADSRSVASLVEKILAEWLREKGHLKK
jgi:hypothetical protein